jgi:predicted porin
MKKHLLALAALATLSSAAFAQSNVTVYGFIDAGMLTTNNAGTSGKNATMATSGQWFPSMIGFTGTEDLGGGLKANFNLQGSLTNQTGAAGDATNSSGTSLFGRYATVGLSGAYGKLDLGRQIDIMFLQSFVNGVIPTHTNSLAVNGLLAYGTAANTNSSTAGAFVNNAVAYVSPSFNGLKLQVQSSVGGQAGDKTKATQTAGILNYDAGSLSLSAGYEVANDASGGVAAKKSLIGAKYTVGQVLLAAQYHTYEQGVAAGKSVDATAYEIGVGYQLNPATLVAVNYEGFDDKKNNTNPKIVSVKAKYDLSKRTYLYGTVANFSKEATAVMYQGYASTLGSATKSATNLGLGIVHAF